MINTLKVKNVVLFDFQEPYSQGLAGEVEKVLKAAGVDDEPSVRRRTRSRTSRPTSPRCRATPTSCSSRRRSRATRRRSRASSPSRARRPRSSAATAPTIRRPSRPPARTSPTSRRRSRASLPTSPIIAAWKKDNPGKAVGSFGPPTYGAVQVILSALKKSCDAGKGSIAKRSALITSIKKVSINTGWILGGKFAWSKVNTNDPNVTQVLHHADPAERLVQARQLGESTSAFAIRGRSGMMPGRPLAFRLGAALWTPSRS